MSFFVFWEQYPVTNIIIALRVTLGNEGELTATVTRHVKTRKSPASTVFFCATSSSNYGVKIFVLLILISSINCLTLGSSYASAASGLGTNTDGLATTNVVVTASAAHFPHALFGFISPFSFFIGTFVVHESQNTLPQALQWCLRRKNVKATPQFVHAGDKSSATQFPWLVLPSDGRKLANCGTFQSSNGMCKYLCIADPVFSILSNVSELLSTSFWMSDLIRLTTTAGGGGTLAVVIHWHHAKRSNREAKLKQNAVACSPLRRGVVVFSTIQFSRLATGDWQIVTVAPRR